MQMCYFLDTGHVWEYFIFGYITKIQKGEVGIEYTAIQ